MANTATQSKTIQFLKEKAARLRIHSILATSASGSGHPTSCASAADIVSVLFFRTMRFDPRNPHHLRNDRFVLSKGHAAPLLYAAWAEAGVMEPAELLTLRKFGSPLEGHPTPNADFVDVATGSLGQGLSAGVGLAISAKHLDGLDNRIYVLLGDGECAEGAVWEAAACASHYKLDNLCAVVDVNRLGQSEETSLGHDMKAIAGRWRAFGWNVIEVDGHAVEQLIEAFDSAIEAAGKPTVVLARTIKGKGIEGAEGRNGYHGKAIPDEEAEKAIQHLEDLVHKFEGEKWVPQPREGGQPLRVPFQRAKDMPFKKGQDPIATRKAAGKVLEAIGKNNRSIAVFDGDVKNSTYMELFEEAAPDRFFQMYIAEQNMVGAAMGVAVTGYTPFVTTFACFLSRAFDFLRMAGISRSNIKVIGSHAGVSIGEDGPSQMGLEDLAMFGAIPEAVILYPTDAVAAWEAVNLAIEHEGMVYIRTGRPNAPVLYDAGEPFAIGKAKVLRESPDDEVTVVCAGVTTFEAVKAHAELRESGKSIRVVDLFSVRPIDEGLLRECAARTPKGIVTVEDHYARGGLGDAVQDALAESGARIRKLAVGRTPRSGDSDELLGKYGISGSHIVRACRELMES